MGTSLVHHRGNATLGLNSIVLFAVLALGVAVPARTQSAEIVLSKEAEPLEQCAAAELQRYLVRLFDVSLEVVPERIDEAEYAFLAGTRNHNPAVVTGLQTFLELSDRGFVLRTTFVRRQALD